MQYAPTPKSVVVLNGGVGTALRGDEGGRVVALRHGHGLDYVALRGSLVRCKDVPADVASDANATWVHLTIRGTFKGHHAGEFSFDDAAFSQIVRNFDAKQTPIAFKYEHPNYEMATGPVPSAGKIHDLRVDDRGLWAFVLFTDRAAEHIRASEYEYCSVVVRFDSVHRVTGEEIGAELIEVGLTDSPYIDGQEPIRLREAA